jgi:aryl-alcohol dehydrogenase-like predicted oxidoreductase
MHQPAQLNYRTLGQSGLRVSDVCLGTMTFGTEWGWGADSDEVRRILDAFAEAGGNFLDTADFYTGGASERMLGDALAANRDRWVVATKYSLHRDAADPNAQGNHRKNLVRAVERSLERLRTPYIDLLWVHAWDFTLNPDDLMWALEHLSRSGKVLHIGISDTPAWIVSSANTFARLRGWQGFTALQVEYSLKERTPERELLPMADALGLAVTAWSPLASGALTGKYETATPQVSRLAAGYPVEVSERVRSIAQRVVAIAQRNDATPSQVAIAWLLSRTRPVVIPILGARSAAQLRENLGARTLRLSDSNLRELDEVSAVPLGFPHDFLRGELATFALWGNMASRITAAPPTAAPPRSAR